MHIGLLACDEVAERFRHVAGDYQEMFERPLSPHIPDLRLTRFDVQAGQTPVDARMRRVDHDGISRVRIR
jgi:hypothetical protein